jgi:hypothetical protein
MNRLNQAKKILSGFDKFSASRTPLEVIFEGMDRKNGTQREFDGLVRMVMGYVPLDFDDRDDLRRKVSCTMSI